MSNEADALRAERMYLHGALCAAVKFHLTDSALVRRLARSKAGKYERASAERRLAWSEGTLLGTLHAVADVDARFDQLFASWARDARARAA